MSCVLSYEEFAYIAAAGRTETNVCESLLYIDPFVGPDTILRPGLLADCPIPVYALPDVYAIGYCAVFVNNV